MKKEKKTKLSSIIVLLIFLLFVITSNKSFGNINCSALLTPQGSSIELLGKPAGSRNLQIRIAMFPEFPKFLEEMDSVSHLVAEKIKNLVKAGSSPSESFDDLACHRDLVFCPAFLGLLYE